jgi:hypothetical protein
MGCPIEEIKENSLKKAKKEFIDGSTMFRQEKDGSLYIGTTYKLSISKIDEIIQKHTFKVKQWASDTFGENFSKNWVIVTNVFNTGFSISFSFPKNLEEAYEIKIEKEKLEKEARSLQEQDAKRAGIEYDDEYLFQVKNIFSSVIELETKLKTINKTPNALGNNKKIDDVLKKAGIEKDLRDQFLQLIKDNPRLKSLKLADILSSYTKEFIKDSDKSYYKAIDEPVSKELENILIDYFDKFNIRKEELDNLKEKFGVDSIGVFDVLAKTIYYAKNRNLLTLPEEYGHVFVELLGSIGNKKSNNPLFKYMFDNIESWDGYQRVFRDYKDKYITAEGNIDIYKIKKEAIGQAIGIALVRNYKNNKNANKSSWDKVFDKNSDFWTKIQEVIDYLYSLLGNIDYVNINLEADKIAKDILSKNYSKLDRLKKDTSNYNLLSYSETIENQNKKDEGLALSFMKWYSDLGNIITGSLAYRLQGTTYRPEIDALHDIDMIVPSNVHNVTLDKSAYLSEEELQKDKIYRKLISEGNYKEAKQYKIQGNLRLNLNKMLENDYFKKIKEKYPDLDFLYTFYNQKANAYYITINAIWSKNQTLKDKFKSYSGSFNSRLENFTPEELDQIYLFDFFLRPEKSEDYITVEDTEYGLNLAHFNYAFYEKLNMMGRAKDAYDYQNWKYFDENNILAPDFNDRMVYFQIQQSKKEKPTEIKPGVEELFDSNPELANQVYEALGFINSQELENLKKEFSSFSNQRDKFKGDLKNTKNLVDVFGQVAADSNFYKPFATDISEQRKKDIISGKATSYIFEDNFDTYRKTIKKSLEDELKSEADRYNYWFDDDTNFYTFDVDSGKYYKYDSNETFTPLEKKYEITKKEYYNSLDNYKNDLEQKNIQEQEDVKENVLRQPFLEGRIVRLFDNHFVIVTDHRIKEKGDSFINEIEFIYYDEFDYDRLKKLEKQEVTPKQKEQAIQQYSQYLNSIFPDSKVKDIVYHGTLKKENILKEGYSIKEAGKKGNKAGIFFYSYAEDAAIIGDILFNIVNITNPLVTTEGRGLTQEQIDEYEKQGIDGITVPVNPDLKEQIENFRTNPPEKLSKKSIDSIISSWEKTLEEGLALETIVFKPSQTHILGSTQDIEGFKEFVESNSTQKIKSEEIETNYKNFINLKPSSSLTEEDWNELTPEEKEMLINQTKNC